jgi:hypothetical protein
MRLSKPSIDWQSVGIVLIVLAIVTFTGLQVATTITEQELQKLDDEELTDTCMGVFGCGENLDEMLPVFALIVVLSFAATYIHSLPRFADRSDEDEL